MAGTSASSFSTFGLSHAFCFNGVISSSATMLGTDGVVLVVLVVLLLLLLFNKGFFEFFGFGF